MTKKSGQATGAEGKKRAPRRVSPKLQYGPSIYKTFKKTVDADGSLGAGMSARAILVADAYTADVANRLLDRACEVLKYSKKTTLKRCHVRAATRVLFGGGAFASHVISLADAACDKYTVGGEV